MFITKQNLKDWRLWYKLAVASLITIFILEMLIKGMVNIDAKGDRSPWAIFGKDSEEVIGYDYFGYVINFFSFFTIQSNILIVVWLMIGFFNHNKEGQIKPLQRTFSLSVVTFITVTALIFNFMLLPQVLTAKPNEFGEKPIPSEAGAAALWWIEQMIVHTLGPIAAVVYFLFFMKQELEFNFKSFILKDFLKMIIYPLSYLAYTLIRGELIYRSYGSNAQLAQKHNAYPYFFLEIHNKNVFNSTNESIITNGLFWLFIAAIAIIGILIGLGSLYLFVATKTSNIRKGWGNEEQKTK
ncbi:Pr6Pr family membrane protein [Spiroplasma sp. BIUS-1]|uniref:Pr6Pr family membrane protein n=1 Tax=Spiroplasma sp. BIUS-1 TaxID=216964 RepID=UPI00139764DD|nr:Pr6Pr family membrane protein [Spiroplasma sp. BIUS-1]QHX36715.1 hypothetical protein SBIUS_v1c04620 [Spiroplasma sp. BIUS-1]